MRTRAMSVVLCAAVGFALMPLSGCGAPSAGLKARDPAVVVVWQDISKESSGLLMRATREFAAANPLVEVRVEWRGGERFVDEVRKAAHSGVGPDVVVTQSSAIDDFVASKVIMPVDFLYRRARRSFLEAGWALVRRGDHRFAVPLSLTTVALFYNRDLVPVPPRSSASLLSKAGELFLVGKLGLVAPFLHSSYTFPFLASLRPRGAALVDMGAAEPYFRLVADLGEVQGMGVAEPSFTEDAAEASFIREDAAMALLSQRAVWSLRRTRLNYGLVPVPKVSGSPSPASPTTSGSVALVSSFAEDGQLAAEVARSIALAGALDGYLEHIGELPAASRGYAREAYRGPNGRALREALATAYVPPGGTSSLLSALDRGLELVLSSGMSARAAASESRALLGARAPTN